MERDGDTTYRRIGAAAGLSEELVKAYPDLQGILETGYVIVRLSPDAALVRKDLAESIRAMFDSADSLRNFFKAFQSCEALLGQEADDSGSNVGRICEEISLQSLDATPGRFSNLVTQAVFELLRVIPAECSKISQLVKEAFGSYTPELMSSLRTRSFQKIVDGGVDQLIRAGTIEDCDIKRPLPEGESDIARPLRMMSPDKGIRRTHPGP